MCAPPPPHPHPQDGVSVEEMKEPSFSDAYKAGLRAYTDQQWEVSRDKLEEALRLYRTYVNRSLECLITCRGMSADSHMTKEEQKLAEGFNGEFPYITEYMNMAGIAVGGTGFGGMVFFVSSSLINIFIASTSEVIIFIAST